jgi:predicted porin
MVDGFTLRLSGSPERQREPGATGLPYSAVLEYERKAVLLMAAFERNSLGDKDTYVAGKYTFGAAAVMAAYDDSRTFDDSGISRSATVSASYRLGPTTLNADTNYFASLGADYALSRRTVLYASVGHKRDAHQEGRTAFGVGMSHGF